MVKEIKGFLSKNECKALVEMIEANNVRSSVVVGGTDRSGISETRTSSTSNLAPNDPTVKSIHQKETKKFTVLLSNILGNNRYKEEQEYKKSILHVGWLKSLNLELQENKPVYIEVVIEHLN